MCCVFTLPSDSLQTEKLLETFHHLLTARHPSTPKTMDDASQPALPTALRAVKVIIVLANYRPLCLCLSLTLSFSFSVCLCLFVCLRLSLPLCLSAASLSLSLSPIASKVCCCRYSPMHVIVCLFTEKSPCHAASQSIPPFCHSELSVGR